MIASRYASIACRAQFGLSAPIVQVEVHATNGLPGLAIVGLPEAAVKESKDRVRSALLSSGFQLPPKRITINLAPADIPKSGSRYDLAIALGILLATGQLDVHISRPIESFEFMGELGLNGEVRAISGILPAVIQGKKDAATQIVPSENLVEAAYLDEAQVLGASHLLEVCRFLANLPNDDFHLARLAKPSVMECKYQQDFADIKGQLQAKRVLEVCATGGHSLMMVGPPGAGKSMLASRLPTIMPLLAANDAIEVASVHSIAQFERPADAFYCRPFYQPHHTSTAPAMVGGGSGNQPKPGMISLAHKGILFLDELPEFSRPVLEALREPLETHQVEVTRVNQKVTFPADFQLICALNPSPSGYFPDDPQNRCKDTPEQIQRYLRKISGPLLDRIDCHLEILPTEFEALTGQRDDMPETSAEIRSRVAALHDMQFKRQGCLNAQLSVKQIDEWTLPKEGELLLKQAVDRLGLSARAYHRVMRLAKTLADMSGHEQIANVHLAEALSYRSMDKRLRAN